MILQQLIVFTLIIAASIYLFNRVKKSFTSKNSCENCAGGCTTIDINKIEKELKSKAIL